MEEFCFFWILQSEFCGEIHATQGGEIGEAEKKAEPERRRHTHALAQPEPQLAQPQTAHRQMPYI